MSAQFIEVSSPTSDIIRWTINLDQIVMVRRLSKDDECTIALSNGGTISPKEPYGEVLALLRIGEIA